MDLEINIFSVPTFISVWSLSLVLFFTFDAFFYIKLNYRNAPRILYFFYGFLAALGIIFSIAIHEFGHAITAYLFGVDVVKASLSFWGANITHKEVGAPLVYLAISLAGPLTNYLLSILLLVVARFLKEGHGENAVQYVSLINWRLGKFNLLPIPPLDGGHVIVALGWMIIGSLERGQNMSLIVGFLFVGYIALKWLIHRKRRVN